MRRFALLFTALTLIVAGLAFGPGVESAAAETGARWTGEYFTNRDLSGAATYVRLDNAIQFNWGGGSPVPGIIPADGFSVRWTGAQEFTEGGTYVFSLRVDDGARLYVDGVLLIDAWYNQIATTHTAEATLDAGLHYLRVEYYDAGDQAIIDFSWRSSTALVPTGGWAAEYYNNPNLEGEQVGGRLEQTLDYNWGGGSPIPGVVNADNFSARWWGFPELAGGTYTFVASADDGVRVIVDGTTVIDAWTPSIYQEHRGTITLEAGLHTVRVEYFDIGDQARVNVYWVREGGLPDQPAAPAATDVTATITTPRLNVRSGPATSWQVITRVSNGEVYPVIGRSADYAWVQISGPDYTGWVSARYVSLAGDTAAVPVTEPTPGEDANVLYAESIASVRIRRGPGTNNARIAALATGDTATVIGRTADNAWLQIRTVDGVEGWVSAAYVNLRGGLALETIPVTG